MSQSSFRVVIRGPSGARVRPNEEIAFNNVTFAPSIRGRVVVRTRWEDLGLEAPVPREIFFEATLEAGSVDQAISLAGPMVMGLASLLAFTTNAPIETVHPHVAYDVTPRRERRAFREYFLPVETGIPRVGRFVDAETFIGVVESFGASPHADRLGRALSQYESALRFWNSPSVVLVLAHLYMACEALTPAVEKTYRERLGISKEEHARRLGIDTDRGRCPCCGKGVDWQFQLGAKVRRLYIFQENDSLYSAARKASDAFEHGFRDMPEIRATAEKVARDLFRLVRNVVLEVLGLPSELSERLLEKEPVDRSSLQRHIDGHLSGAVTNPDCLAAPNQLYPLLRWEASIGGLVFDDPDLRLKPLDRLTAVFAEGVSFDAEGFAVYGGMNDKRTLRPEGEVSVELIPKGTQFEPH